MLKKYGKTIEEEHARLDAYVDAAVKAGRYPSKDVMIRRALRHSAMFDNMQDGRGKPLSIDFVLQHADKFKAHIYMALRQVEIFEDVMKHGLDERYDI